MQLNIERKNIRELGNLGFSGRILRITHALRELYDPTIGTQLHLGRRRVGDSRIPRFVSRHVADRIIREDAKQVVVIGNGGFSSEGSPLQWSASSIVGMVDGRIPGLAVIPLITAKSTEECTVLYASPTLVIGRGDGRISMWEVKFASIGLDENALVRLRTELREIGKTVYGLIHVNDTSTSVIATSSYRSFGKEDDHPEKFQRNGPVTLVVSANGHDWHGIDTDGKNMHLIDLRLPAHVTGHGLLFSLEGGTTHV